jgi:predicted PurR-regulated permease PerM
MLPENNKVPFYAKLSLISIGMLALCTMLYLSRFILIPLIYATILAILLSPVVDLFVRKKMNRTLAISITVTVVILTTLSLLLLLSSQLIQFTDSLPNLINNFHKLLDQTVAWTSDQFNIRTSKINLWITEKNAEVIKNTGSKIGQTLLNTGGILVVLLLIPVYIFMILFYQPQIIAFIHKLFKSDNHKNVKSVITATKSIVQSYLVGLLLESAIVAVLNCTALLLIGIEYAILLGIIGALLNFIPYLGGIIAVTLPMLIALASNAPANALLVLVAYLFIQLIDNNYIIPKVVASKVQINGLVTIVAVLAGGAIGGIPGMFLSIPLTAILKVIFDHVEGLKPWGYLLGDVVNPSLKKHHK